MSSISDTQAVFTRDVRDPLSKFRDRFVFSEPNLIYLDGNSLGRLPREAVGLTQKLVEKEWGHDLIRGWNKSWFTLQERLGAKIAKIIGAQPDEVIVADSTSINLFKLTVAALKAQNDRQVIVTDDLNFPSDLYIFQGALELLSGRHLSVIESEDGIYGPVDKIIKELNDQTAVVSLSHTVFKSGYTYDMKQINDAAHNVGALTLWDLSHSAGAVPVRLNETGADMAVGCSYKYLNGGPGAPAFLYVRKDLQKKLNNPISGWFGQKDMFDFGSTYEADHSMRRFLAGTPPVLSTAVMEPGLDIMLEAGIDQIREKSVKQTESFIKLYDQHLAELGFRLNTPREAAVRGSHISLGHDDGWRINQALIHNKDVLPDFRPPNNLRFGIAPLYNSFSDIHTAVMRLRAIMQNKIYERYSVEKPAVT